MEYLAAPPHAGDRTGVGQSRTDQILAGPMTTPRVRSRYKPAVLQADGMSVLERLSIRYRSLQALRTPALIAAAGVLVFNVGLSAVSPGWLQGAMWLWSGLLVTAALWHWLPPAFAAPDLYWRMARSIDPLEPASEADQQVLSMTRFAWMVAGVYVLVANDLIREARLRFYDIAAAEWTDASLQAAVAEARASADRYWVNVALLVLGFSIALGTGRRLHAVDGVSYTHCPALASRTRRGVGWYVVLTGCAVGAVVGRFCLATSLAR